MSFLWVGGRRVYFGWNLKHEVLCGCLNTLWHVVWEEGWARGGAELCGCRKQSSPAAGNSFGDSPPGKYLAAEKPMPACYVLVQWVKTESRPSVGSILPFCMWAGRLGRRCREFSMLCSPPTARPAGAVIKHPAVGEVGAEPSPWLGKGHSCSCWSCWRAATGTGAPVCCSLLDQTQGRRLRALPSGPLNHPARPRDEERL